MVQLAIRWDAVRELQVVQPGFHEECRADRHGKEAGKMDKMVKGL